MPDYDLSLALYYAVGFTVVVGLTVLPGVVAVPPVTLGEGLRSGEGDTLGLGVRFGVMSAVTVGDGLVLTPPVLQPQKRASISATRMIYTDAFFMFVPPIEVLQSYYC
jgi:hypothetical protein